MSFVFIEWAGVMSQSQTALLADTGRDELLTTGEAARLLGVSRQHVVDLCDAGDLPHSLIGKHHRVLRSDVDAIRTGRSRMNRQDTQSLLLAYAIAGEIVRDPMTVLEHARENLRAMQGAPHAGSSHIWLAGWEKLLNGTVLSLLQALTAITQRSRELRQNSPFAGILTDTVRNQVLTLVRGGRANQ